MKNYILFFALLMGLSFCSTDDEPTAKKKQTAQTDSAILPFYDTFLSAATSHGIEFKETVVLQFGDCDCQKDGVWYVPSNADDEYLEFYVFHVLGHALLNKQETTQGTIMDLKSAPQYPYHRDVMLDQLFE